jgi:tetratricopeptide (TPR) repeat protein
MNDFMNLLDMGKFHEAKKVWYEITSEQKRWNMLADLTSDTNSIGIYTFIIRLLLENETADFHSHAATILELSLWEGAYTSALSHARRAVELSDELKYKEYLLSYYSVPDCDFERQDAIQLAKEIIQLDPSNKTAMEILGQITRQHINQH